MIAVLGGGGFIGSAIVDRLLQDGHDLRVLERPRVEPHREFLPREHVEWQAGDFMNLHDIGSAIEGADAVIHLVWTTIPETSKDDPVFDITSNLIASVQLLKLMVAKGVSRIVFISSGGTVYGKPIYLPIDEQHPTDPSVPYGITKLAIEKYLGLFRNLHGLDTTVLRVSNPFGPRQRPETGQGVVATFLNRILRDEVLEIWGDGTVVRDYIHVSDVAEAFASALAYHGPHSVFNVCSGEGTSLNELMGMIERVIGSEVSRRYTAGRPFDVPVSVLDNSLARRELGWMPRVSLEDGLASTADWMKETLGNLEVVS